MASRDQMKKVVGMMLAAILFVAVVANPEKEAGACIGSTSDVPGVPNACISSKNCACAGMCILNAVDGDDVKTCFVECMPKNDCGRCPGPLPAILGNTLRLNVTRPRVPRSSNDKETLVIGVVVEPCSTGEAVFDVYVNVPEGVNIKQKHSEKSQNDVWPLKATPSEIYESGP